MKRFMQTFFLLIFLFSSGMLTAQLLQTNGECGNDYEEEVVDQCFPKSEYSKQEAIRQFRADMLSGYTCTNNCNRPALYNCKAKIVSTPSPSSSTTHWCFNGTVEWKCTKCARIPINIDPDPNLPITGDEKESESVENQFKVITDNIEGTKFGQVLDVSPNPASDFVKLNIHLEKDISEIVEISLMDINGKQILHREYFEIPHSTFQGELELVNTIPGIYFLSVVVDGLSIGSSKIIIQ